MQWENRDFHYCVLLVQAKNLLSLRTLRTLGNVHHGWPDVRVSESGDLRIVLESLNGGRNRMSMYGRPGVRAPLSSSLKVSPSSADVIRWSDLSIVCLIEKVTMQRNEITGMHGLAPRFLHIGRATPDMCHGIYPEHSRALVSTALVPMQWQQWHHDKRLQLRLCFNHSGRLRQRHTEYQSDQHVH